MDKKQSLPVKIRIILYVDQISWGREPSDQCTKSTPKKKKKKKEQKRLGLSVNDEDRKRERERESFTLEKKFDVEQISSRP